VYAGQILRAGVASLVLASLSATSDRGYNTIGTRGINIPGDFGGHLLILEAGAPGEFITRLNQFLSV